MRTRTASPGSPLRQERFSSSPRFEQGLSANLVARRCQLIDPPSDRHALWFIQYRSWTPGSLKKLTEEILETYPLADLADSVEFIDYSVWQTLQKSLVRSEVIRNLPRCLSGLCLDPDCGNYDLLGPPKLLRMVDDYRRKWIASRACAVFETEIGKRISSGLAYAIEAETMVLIDGPARLGKTFAAKAFCEQSGGLMRYVQVPSATDMASFVREIAESLGLATNLNLKVQVLLERIRDSLASGDIGICFDEAHYCWPQGRLRNTAPARINFIMTELCNRGISVALVTTPQFYTAQALLEKQTAWTSEQFIGRLGHTERLPDKLGESDLKKVASALLPSADAEILEALAQYAYLSKKHLASIESIAKRATWLANKEGQSEASKQHVKRAMKESVLPSDMALQESIAVAKAPARKPRGGFAPHPRPAGRVAAEKLSRSVLLSETVET